MNCSNCGNALDTTKKGFIVCPKCQTVNTPPASAGFKEHHIAYLPNHDTSVVHASPAENKHKLLFLLLGSVVSILLISTIVWSATHRNNKSIVQTQTKSPSKDIPITAPQITSPSKTTNTQKTNPAPAPAAQVASAQYQVNVLVLKYFPLTSNRQNIDINTTGDVGDPYSAIRQRTIDTTNNLKASIEKSTEYLGYKNPTAQSSISPNIIDTKEYTQAVPIKATHGIPTVPDYSQVLNSNDICDYVNNKNVREVWLWAYQGPNKANGYPSLAISESKMSSPYGDISNSYRYDDMPKCAHTYVVYSFNYGRGTAEAFHSWGHQIEAELTEVDNNMFRGAYEGPDHPQALGVNGKCGSVHNPPNARFEYDYANPAPQKSNCLDWHADGSGQTTAISCQNWGCQNISDTNNPQLNWLVLFWQNLPGKDNSKTYQGKHLRNWWDVHADFDNVMAKSRYLAN
jgi:hypothetical protein